eukprot:GHVR01049105.1.p1 GENE.GHVR01049105.1~~GHVR01049105.1.p1  ORF type:complete len:102 (+),score=16.61 GHVR01049105.1:185-490(+)
MITLLHAGEVELPALFASHIMEVLDIWKLKIPVEMKYIVPHSYYWCGRAFCESGYIKEACVSLDKGIAYTKAHRRLPFPVTPKLHRVLKDLREFGEIRRFC